MTERKREDEGAFERFDEKAQAGAEELTREVEEKGVIGAIKDDLTPGDKEEEEKKKS